MENDEKINEEENEEEVDCEKCGEPCGTRLVGDEIASYCSNCN